MLAWYHYGSKILTYSVRAPGHSLPMIALQGSVRITCYGQRDDRGWLRCAGESTVTPIYHITHTRNLASSISQGGLCCDMLTADRALTPVGIAHSHIKARRARRQVLAGTGGTLADYVPFYFARRSPMLYAIDHGFVAGYTEGQRPIVHLVTSAERIAQQGLRFAFTDGHADMALSRFFDDLQALNQIDWQVMQAPFWNDTAEDGDRKRRRQAEFLVHHFFPWTLVEEIGVIGRQVAHDVQQSLQASAPSPGDGVPAVVLLAGGAAMIEHVTGNLLEAEAEAFVNTVNTVGVMGKGIALQFRQAFPENYTVYRAACERGEVQPGRMLVVPTGQMGNPRYIINFPTKRHWKGKSRMEDIESGLPALVAAVQEYGMHSLAVPPLGCGNGGLDWNAVRPRIEAAFTALPDVHVLLYAPTGAPNSDPMRSIPVARA